MGKSTGQICGPHKNAQGMKALVSIHDLMPETFELVEQLLDWLQNHNVPPVTLLVVPGKDWLPSQIERLRQLADLGYELAAHGWYHRTNPKKLFHKCHAALLSRNVAEHLDLDSRGVFELMLRSGQWFSEQNLPEPQTYVPPSWALGPLKRSCWPDLPYRIIETTSGIIDTRRQKRTPLPLVGFEADTDLRSGFLSSWNKIQTARALRLKKVLRISIHPKDLQLRLAGQMEAIIRQPGQFIRYQDL